MNSERSLFSFIIKFIKVLIEIALIIAGINFIVSTLSKSKDELGDEGEYYSWRLGKIFYRKRGSGSPVLLIHGLEPASSQKDIAEKASELSGSHTVYTMDLLGFGKSDKPWITYTNYIYVLLINDFIKNIIKDESCKVIAYEGSCLSAMQANSLRENAGQLELINPYTNRAFSFSTGFALRLKSLIELPLIGTFLYNLFCLGGHFKFDAESKYVVISRLTGHLETDISGHKDLIKSNVEIKHQ